MGIADAGDQFLFLKILCIRPGTKTTAPQIYGIRTGVDVFKALALGADAVLICRPFVTAVYGGGEEGVKCYIDKIAAELADTMQMCGAHSLAEITRDMVRI